MIPQLAHPPRQLPQQFGSSAFAASPFEPLQDPRGPSQFAPLPFRSPRSAAFAPSPVSPYTVESHSPRDAISANRSVNRPNQSFAGQYNDSAEHMLRRKTPNGTLAAGYDGTPIQWSGKVPALKHVVLPMSAVPSNQQATSSDSTPTERRARQRSNSVGWVGQQPGVNSGNINGGLRMNSDPGNWSYFSSPLNPPSNVLDHLSMQQATTFYPNNGIQIPTVIQPGYQASPGPTASNDAGLYGPYWPDGKFVPYRPAAYRGQGYQQGGNGWDVNRGFQQQINSPMDMLSSFRQAPYNLNSTPHMRRPSFLSLDTGSDVSDPVLMLGNQHGQPQLVRDTAPSAIYMSPADGSRTPTAQSKHRPNSHHFKEKTLSWAHSIYVGLLAFLHQSRKDSRQSRQHYQGFRPKATIYPKPPRQPASSFGNSDWSASYVPSSGNDTNGVRQQADTMFPSSRRSNSTNSFGAWHGSADFGEGRYSRFSNQDMPHYVSPFHSSQRATDPPLSKAKEALEVLTSLCEQSGWLWIDGMLLGGCLAYGLEEYHKALDWYSKILALDTKYFSSYFVSFKTNYLIRHVEAMSNLAATLLCLNRREEAEQHWLQSVKLRPNYFEAVEHLIGLLCGDHRSNEAVTIIEYVERSLQLPKHPDESHDYFSETSSNADRESCGSLSVSSDKMALDYDGDDKIIRSPQTREIEDGSTQHGFGSSGFSVPGSDNGRMLALIHAKGNMLYALGDVDGASKAFEHAVLISAGRTHHGIQRLIKDIISVLSTDGLPPSNSGFRSPLSSPPPPLLLPPDKALQTAKLVFAKSGDLPGLRHVPEGLAKRAAISTTSNSLLSLAKIFQDSMSNSNCTQRISRMPTGVGDILALYYLSLSLQPSPSTANNVGILLASVQQPAFHRPVISRETSSHPTIPGVVPGSGVALALAYYNYGLNLDSRHAHLYTNLGSLLKDIGQLNAAIKMYEQAVNCDGSFDIALANLANAVKDQGRTNEAIAYYRRAVASSPDFAEAVCGLANALNSVCDWTGRGGVILDGGRQDQWHVDDAGMITRAINGGGSGWMKRVVDIVGKQLKDGAAWGRGALRDQAFHQFLQQIEVADTGSRWQPEKRANMHATLSTWIGHRWEGARVLRLIERAIKRALHRWYHDKHVKKKHLPASSYRRPQLPGSLTVPSAPTVLPFHTFTCPLSAKDIRMISQRNAFRISCSTLKAPWMQGSIFPPPSPPAPHLNIGYVSSDFNNHPLAHL
jgi:tetratricopeptide (TPR) repeat protein